MTQNKTSFTKPTLAPFRNDIVGSFLRPEKLKTARQQFETNQITSRELRYVEDKLIIDLLKKEEAVGLQSVTDGEFRRSWYHLDFFWGLQGVKKI